MLLVEHKDQSRRSVIVEGILRQPYYFSSPKKTTPPHSSGSTISTAYREDYYGVRFGTVCIHFIDHPTTIIETTVDAFEIRKAVLERWNEGLRFAEYQRMLTRKRGPEVPRSIRTDLPVPAEPSPPLLLRYEHAEKRSCLFMHWRLFKRQQKGNKRSILLHANL